MARFKKNGGGSTDLPLTDGTRIQVLGPEDESNYEREHVGPMFRVLVVEGLCEGQIHVLFDDEIEED